MRVTQAPRRSPPRWAEALCRDSRHSICVAPPSATRGPWRGASGPCAGPAAAARAGDSQSRQQPARRRGPRRPRGAAVAGRCAAAAGWSDGGAQDARLNYTQITDAGCATLATALYSGSLPALEMLYLGSTPARGAAKAAVREALAKSRSAPRRRPPDVHFPAFLPSCPPCTLGNLEHFP